MTRISESELILPALHILANRKSTTTSELIRLLRELLKPSGEDLVVLEGRNDDKFSQKVRNLKSHNTLSKHGLVREVKINPRQTAFEITDKGRALYNENKDNLQGLLAFPFEETKTILSRIADGKRVGLLSEDLIIVEGEIVEKQLSYIRKRSTQLRQLAIEHYSQYGRISCSACSFEFKLFYGAIANGYIEIHHLNPICEYPGEVALDLTNALKSVVPLCANCHRVVHLSKPILTIQQLKESILNATKSP